MDLSNFNPTSIPFHLTIRSLCRPLGWEATTIREQSLCRSALSEATRKFRKDVFKYEGDFPLDPKHSTVRRCAEEFCDLDSQREMRFFHKNEEAVKKNHLALPDDRDKIIELLCPLFCFQEFITRRNKLVHKRGGNTKKRLPIPYDDDLSSELSEVGYDTSSDEDENEDKAPLFPGLAHLGIRSSVNISGHTRSSHSSAVHRGVKALGENSSHTKTMEDHCRDIYPQSFTTRDEITPLDISFTSDQALQGLDIYWLFGGPLKWPQDVNRFVCRWLHERGAYFRRMTTAPADEVELLTSCVLVRLRITCGDAQRQLAKTKVLRFITDRSRRWLNEGLLTEVDDDECQRTDAFDDVWGREKAAWEDRGGNIAELEFKKAQEPKGDAEPRSHRSKRLKTGLGNQSAVNVKREGTVGRKTLPLAEYSDPQSRIQSDATPAKVIIDLTEDEALPAPEPPLARQSATTTSTLAISTQPATMKTENPELLSQEPLNSVPENLDLPPIEVDNPLMTFIPSNFRGHLQFENLFEMHLSEFERHTISSFFALYTQRSSVALGLIDKLSFTLVFADNTKLPVGKSDSERAWKTHKRRVKSFVLEELRKESDADEYFFEVWVKVV